MVLEPTMERVLEKISHFEQISFAHIYRDFNHKVDQLSKEALGLQEGILLENEVRDNIPQ